MKLPVECQVDYYEDFISASQSAEIYNWIHENCQITDANKIVMADGTIHTREMGKCMFVDQELTDFSVFIKEHGRRIEWPQVLIPLRDKVEAITGAEFAVCVGIFYRSGDVGLNFHSDFPAFGPTSLIPSISLGAKRTLVLRKRSDPANECKIELANGSLIIMGEGCQEDYEHAVPIDTHCKEPRINLTFRPFSYSKNQKRNKRIN